MIATEVHGIVLVDKPENVYTGDVVGNIKKRFRVKVGHSGVIDYIGSGLIILLVNNATKISDFLLNTDKEYIATGLLGRKTDTMDISGNILEEKDYSAITEGRILEVISQFIGDVILPTPIFSNKKLNGMRLHKLARQRESLRLEEIPEIFSRVKIYSMELVGFSLPYFTIKGRCSKGTYIRSLINSIGERLGSGATMYSLRRMAVGNFTIDKAVKLNEIMKMDFDSFRKCVISINEALGFLSEIEIKDNYIPIFIRGGGVPAVAQQVLPQDYVRVTFMGELLGIGRIYYMGDRVFVKMYKKC